MKTNPKEEGKELTTNSPQIRSKLAVEEGRGWREELKNLPQTDMTTEQFIENLIRETLEKVEENLKKLPAYSNREFAETKEGLYLKLEPALKVVQDIKEGKI